MLKARARRSRRDGTSGALVKCAQAAVLAATSLVFVGTQQAPIVSAAAVCASPPLTGTTTVSGVVNTYYPGQTTTLAAGQANTTVTVGTSTGASAALGVGDLVMVIQMQGAEIDATNTGAYGDGVAGDPAQGNLSTNFLAGRYEFARVASVAGSTIGLQGSGTNDGLTYPYRNGNASSTVGQFRYQLVRVPQYSSAVLSVATPPSGPAWNGTTGGVVVLDAASNLNLNAATIDMSARGFRPGLQRQRSGASGLANTDYRTLTNQAANGQKAEGIAGMPVWRTGDADTVGNGYPNGDFGRGAPGNGGGGGTDGRPVSNDENSGGGGGGNGGAGGRGGNTWNSNLARGGFGGATVPGAVDRVFMGGGGGAGSDNDAVLNSSGGAGGGIVVVRAGSLSGTGTITANGEVGKTSGQDGAGGAGAGGTVIVATSATGAASGIGGLTINAVGAVGGNETHSAAHGPGGGGGGGRIITSVAPAAANVNGGANGLHVTAGGFGATAGANGIASTASLAAIPGANTGSVCIDLAVTKSVSPTPVVPGQAVTYTVVVTNKGPHPRSGTATVGVVDAVPAALSSVTWTCAASAGSTCGATSGSGSPSTTANLAVNGTATYTITGTLSPSFAGTLSNTATASPPSGVPELTPTDNTATVTSVAQPRADLAITKTDGSTTATPGTNATYTVVVSNAGPSAVIDALVTDALPAGTSSGTWSCAAGAGASCGAASGTMPMNTTASLASGSSATYTVAVAIPASATGSVVNTAQVAAPAGVVDPNSANNSATDTDTLSPRADLSITKTDGITTVDAGTGLTYTIVATNTGPSTITGASVADTLPAQLTGATWSCTAAGAGSSCPASGTGDISATVNLGVSGTATFTVVATVSAGATGTLSNTATIAAPSGATDPTPGNNSATDTTTITRRADLRITKTDGQTTAVPGQNVTYTIVASNPIGPSTVTGATVVDTLPAQLTGATWSCTAAGSGSSCPASGTGNVNAAVNLGVGGTATFTLTATVTSTATGSVTNTAVVNAPVGVTDPTPSNNTASDTDTLTPQADLVVTKTDGALTEVPGTSVTYTIVAANPTGPSAVTGATLADTPPATITGVTWTCAGSGGATCPAASGSGAISQVVDLPVGSALTYTLTGTISANATGTLTNTATLPAPSGVTDPTPANNTATDTDTLNPTGDLRITKTDGATFEIPGTPVSYTVVASNPVGPSNMVGATVADTIPANLAGATWTCTAAGGATCGAASGSGSINTTVDLPVGATATFVLNATVLATATGSLSNTATITANPSTIDPNGSNNSATDIDSLDPTADLSITKTDGATTATPGSTVTYTITAANAAGPSAVTGATVVDNFSGAFTGATWTCSATGGGACPAASGSGNINALVNLAVGANVTFTVTGTLSSTATGTLTNTATVSVPTGVTESNSADNSATDTDTITPTADLSITKTDGQTSSVPGQGVTYTIVATNGGPSTVTGATVADTVPAALTGATWTCVASAGSSCPASGSGNIAANVTLAPGGTATFTLTATVAPGATGSLSNTATVTPPGTVTDPTPGNNSATDTNTLTPSADVTVTKTDGITTIAAGQATTYTIVVGNAGPSTVNNVTVADTIPAGLTGASWTCTASAGSSCPASGTGSINAVVDLVPSGTATFTLTGTVSPAATGNLVNTATATLPTGAGLPTDPTPGNNSATDSDTIARVHDLAITKTDGSPTAIPGQTVTYTVVVSNPTGPSNAVGATVTDTFPATLSGVTWTCSAAGGASCPASGSGNIGATVDVPVGGTATFTATGTLSASATGTLSNTASVAVPAGSSDPTPGNNSATDDDTISPTADLSITKTDGQTSAVPGAAISYTIVVMNGGPSAVTSAAVTDTFPAALVAPTWTCAPAGGGSCAASSGSGSISTTVSLPPAATATFIVSATVASTATGSLVNTSTVSAPGGVTDPTPANNTATDTDSLTPTADLSITKTDGVTSATPGGSTTYTITVSNTGPSAVTGAAIADALPAEVTSATWTCAGTTGGTCATASGTGSITTTANLPVGGSVTYTVVATISASATGSLVNTATVSAPAGVADPTPANNSATDTDSLTPTADLSITKTDGQTSSVPGAGVSYTIVVTNGGPSQITGATVTDTPPAQLTGVTWTCVASAGSSCPASGSGSINSAVTLAPSGTATFTLGATVASSATGSVTNTASVALPGGATDPTPANNSASDTNTITPFADLSITKTDGSAVATPGTSTTYTIVATNAGPSDAPGTVITDAIPAGVTSFSWTCTGTAGGTCTASGSGAINQTVDLPAGSTVTFTVTATISTTATGVVTNTAILTPPATVTDTDTTDNTATDTDTLGPQADISVSKTDGATTATPGGTTTYTIVVANAGPSTAPGTSVTDAEPAGATFTSWTCAPAPGAACFSSAGSGAISTTVDLPANTSATFTVTAAISPTATGNLVNQVTASPPTGTSDRDASNNTATDTDALTPDADLSITKTDGQTSAIPGDAVQYTIVVRNDGPSAVTDAPVTDTLPLSLTGATWTCTATAGSNCDAASGSGSISTTVDLAAGGGQATFVVDATIDPAATGSVVNTAVVDLPPGVTDPDAADRSATDTDTLAPQADLAITKTDGLASAQPFATVSYTIVVRNNGQSTVANASVTDTIPAGLSGATWTCTNGVGGVCDDALGTGDIATTVDLAPNGSVTIVVDATVAAGATGTISNTATVAVPSGVIDPTPANNSATDDTTVTPTADISITKTDNQTTAVPGTALTYVVEVANSGPSTVNGVAVADSMPPQLTGITWTCVGAGGATCGAGSGAGDIATTVNLPGGSAATFTVSATVVSTATGSVSNTATVTLPAGVVDPDTADHTATDTDTLTPAANLAVTKDDGATSATPGGTTTYTINVSNPGPSAISGATVVDNLPAEVTSATWTCAGASGGSCAAASGSGDINTAVDLPVGGSAQFSLTVSISAAATGSLVNTATVSVPAGATELDPSDNLATDTDTLTPNADVSISKTDGQTTVVAGTAVVYTIVASNAGPSNVNNAIVTDTLPTGLTNATWSCSATVGSTCPASGTGSINANVDLAVGGSATFTLSATVASGAVGTIANTASVALPTGAIDPTPANNSATDTDTVARQADLGITKDDGVTSATPGASTTYTVTVSNTGPSDAFGALVTDSLPSGATGMIWTCSGTAGGVCAASGSGAIAESVDLPSGASISFVVAIAIDAAATGSLTNTATVAPPSGVTDANTANDSATDVDTLAPIVDVSASKDDGATTAVAGTSIVYTIVVANAGPSAAPGTAVNDPNPVGAAITSWSCVAETGSSCGAASGAGALATTANVAAGGFVTYTVTVAVDPIATGQLTNTVTATAASGITDSDTANDAASDTDAIVVSGDLSISKTDGRTTATPGATTQYTIVVTNAGPSAVFDAPVADTMPATLGSVTWACSATAGSACDDPSGVGDIASTVDLAPGGSATFVVDAVISSTASGTLSNTATVDVPFGVVDPDDGDRTATDTTNLVASVDLGITKTDNLTAVQPLQSTTYDIVVTNTGVSDAIDAVVTDALPAELVGPTWTCTAGSGGSCDVGSGSGDIFTTVDLAAIGGTVTFTITATVSASASGSITNTASVAPASGDVDTDPSNNSASDTSTVTPVADLTITKTDGLTSTTIGSTVVYTIVVGNDGPSTVVGARVQDLIPAQLGSVSWTCTPSGAGAACANPSGTGSFDELVDLAPTTTATFAVTGTVVAANGTITNTATVAAPTGVTDPDPADNSATDTTPIAPTGNLSITKTDGATTVTPGAPTTYTIVVTNDGPSDLTDITVDDTMPAELTAVSWTCAASPGSSCAATAGTADISTTVDLIANGTATFNVNATIDRDATGVISNTATITPPPLYTDADPTDDSATDTSTAAPRADLTITKTDNQTTTVPGTVVTYTITVGNVGPSTAVGATVADTPPAALTGATWTCAAFGGATCGAASGTGAINDTIDIPPTATVTYTLSGTVDPGATADLSNTAAVTAAAGTTDPDTTNNSATDVDTLTPRADLSITKTDGATSAVPGTAIRYSIVVSNGGPSAVTGALVTDAIPASVTGATWTCAAISPNSCSTASGSGDINATVDLAASGRATFVIDATISATATTTVTNSATVAPPSGVTDPVPSNNTATDDTALTPQANLTIAKTDGVATLVPGRTVTYTITAGNLGPSGVTGATITDILPPALSGATWTCSGAGGATCATASGSGDIMLGVDIPAGGGSAITIVVTGTVDPAATGLLSNTASIATPAGVTELDVSDNSATDVDTLDPIADLSVMKTDGLTGALPGDTIQYDVVVSNGGPSAVTGAPVDDPIPPELTNATWTCAPAAGASCGTPSGSGDVAILVDLGVGTSATITITAEVVSTVTGTVANRVTIQAPAGVGDPDPSNNAATDSTTISPLADVSVTKTDGVTTTTAGAPTTYSILVTNPGPSDLLDVRVTDPLPSALTAATWTCVGTGGAVCSATGSGSIDELLDMPASSTARFTVSAVVSPSAAGKITNTVDVTLPVGAVDPTPSNNFATDVTDVLGVSDLAILKVANAPTAVPGQGIGYTLTVTNSGPSDAVGVTVDDAFPAALSGAIWTCTAAGGASCGTSSGTGDVALLVDVPVGGQITIGVTADVDPDAVGQVSNTATVTPPGATTDPDPSNNTSTATVQLDPVVNLAVTKTDGTAVATPGASTTYSIVVTNAGPSTAIDAIVTDVVPAGVTASSWTCTGASGATCGAASGTGDISTTVTVPPGGSIDFAAQVSIDADARGALTNVVDVTAAPGVVEADPTDNTATDTDDLNPSADLSISKTDGRSRVEPGDVVVYTIVVTNSGASSIVGAAVSDPVPAGLTGASWSCVASSASACGTASGSGSISTTADLAVGGSVTYTMTGTVAPDAADGPAPTIVNTATVTAPGDSTDPDPSNNSATDTDTVGARFALEITKVADRTTIAPGDELVYTIVVGNAGPSAIAGVLVEDRLPDGLRAESWTCAGAGGATCSSSSGTGAPAVTVDLPADGSVTIVLTTTVDLNSSTATDLVNLVVATVAGAGGTVTAEADATVRFEPAPPATTVPPTVPPTTPPTTPSPRRPQIPRSGSDPARSAVVALFALLAGMALVRVSRRRT